MSKPIEALKCVWEAQAIVGELSCEVDAYKTDKLCQIAAKLIIVEDELNGLVSELEDWRKAAAPVAPNPGELADAVSGLI